jgi:hypothetical protein
MSKRKVRARTDAPAISEETIPAPEQVEVQPTEAAPETPASEPTAEKKEEKPAQRTLKPLSGMMYEMKVAIFNGTTDIDELLAHARSSASRCTQSYPG